MYPNPLAKGVPFRRGGYVDPANLIPRPDFNLLDECVGMCSTAAVEFEMRR